MDMSAMNHSSSTMTMAMVFTNSHNTPLFSSQWTPSSNCSYAGTCIFLVILSIIARGLVALKSHIEQRWLRAHLKRRYIIVVDQMPKETLPLIDAAGEISKLVIGQAIEEGVYVVVRDRRDNPPWRYSVDLPRALLFLCIAGVSYLLMLAVMTMNVGYFCSVLGGSFLGELAVGRFAPGLEMHGH
ncbi:Ctr copper transporter [Aspergillus californicus]